MKIKAKFKGSDSLGYINGENYHLVFSVDEYGEYIWIVPDKRHINCQSCPYSTLKAFLNNWQVF